MSRVRIDVTQELIDAGERYRSDCCPINLAAEIAFPGVACRTLRTHIAVGDSEVHAPLPIEARNFMWLFDIGHDVAPISFEVEDPRPC